MPWCFFCEKQVTENLQEHHVLPKRVAEFLEREEEVIFLCPKCHDKLHQYGADPNLSVVAPLLYEFVSHKKELFTGPGVPAMISGAVDHQRSTGKPGIEWLLGILKAMQG